MYRSDRERGQTVLEFLLVLLVLLPLLFGGISLARGIGLRHALDSGVSAAVRALSLDPTQWSWAVQVVKQALDDNVLGGPPPGSWTLQAYDAAGAPLSPSALAGLAFGSRFRLEARLNYTPDLVFFTAQTVTIRVSHWGIVERYP